MHTKNYKDKSTKVFDNTQSFLQEGSKHQSHLTLTYCTHTCSTCFTRCGSKGLHYIIPPTSGQMSRLNTKFNRKGWSEWAETTLMYLCWLDKDSGCGEERGPLALSLSLSLSLSGTWQSNPGSSYHCGEQKDQELGLQQGQARPGWVLTTVCCVHSRQESETCLTERLNSHELSTFGNYDDNRSLRVKRNATCACPKPCSQKENHKMLIVAKECNMLCFVEFHQVIMTEQTKAIYAVITNTFKHMWLWAVSAYSKNEQHFTKLMPWHRCMNTVWKTLCNIHINYAKGKELSWIMPPRNNKYSL